MCRIILVDDEKGALEEMTDELREQGWEVDSFNNPRGALQSLEEKTYEVGILDIKMPGMSGVELLERARALQMDMDVIFITAYPELQTAIDAVQLGALDYIKRPFENQELVQVVKRTLTYRSLRLESAELASKLETLRTIASEIDLNQALSEILSDTLARVASTVSPNYVYIAFVEQEGLEPILAAHRIDNDQVRLFKEQLAHLKSWLNRVIKESLRVSDISEDRDCPLRLGGTKALLLAPIFHEQTLSGALLCGAPQKDAFSLNDERFVVAIAHFVSYVVDRAITADKLRRAEEEKQDRLREHYKRTVEYLRAVAGGAAHDIKNPLTIISGRVEKVIKSLGESSSVLKDLKVIEDQILRADERMNEILYFCYQTDLWVRKTVEVSKIVKETEVALRHIGLPDGIELVLQPVPESLLIECDPLQLKRALKNVIDNAIRATEGSGRITVAISSAHDNVEICVHNMGKPIPPEKWEDIFKPRITSKAITGRYQRSGYGLPITRGILMNHRGNVVVKSSEEEKGTTFLITIPIAKGKEEG